jgi:thiamine biosynthesis lipoprotein
MNMETAVKQSCISREFTALGTMNSIVIYDCFENQLLDEAVKRVAQIDGKMSAFNSESEVSILNRDAGRKSVVISEETFLLLKLAKEFGKLSGGAFDITIHPLVELWGINKKLDFIPEKPEIDKVLRLVDYNDLVLDELKHTAYLKKAGQAVDLGGIAKGYAADEVKRLLMEGGVKSALINLGGNIMTIGGRTDGGPWQIGVQNPASVRGEYLGTLAITDRTVVTSGSNEQLFIKDGRRYHHILDPRTGAPSQSGLQSVTVIGKSSVEADALTTAIFVLGMEKGMELLEKHKADAVFATNDYRVYLTRGLVNQFVMNEVQLGHKSGRLF